MTQAVSKHNIGEYEQMRQRNMEDNKAVLEKLMSDLKHALPTKPSAPRKARASLGNTIPTRRNPSRNARSTPSRLHPPTTRSRRGSVSSSISSSSSSNSTSTTPEKMVVRFGFFRKAGKSDVDDRSLGMDFDEDEEAMALLSPVRRPVLVRETRSAEEITDEDLDMVAMFVSDKKYDSIYGSSCHQCRQKTLDMKTICRSGHCMGVRGQFCGPCLRNRYGEDARAALKNPTWECPPCRHICNCSFCRKKAGKSCTGILIHLARDNGYSDVNSYLQGLRKKD